MTFTEMIALLPDNNSPVETVGRGFFSVQTSLADRKQLLEYLLKEERYAQLVALICCGHINGAGNLKNTGADFRSASDIHTRYFSLFLTLVSECGIAEQAYIPLVIAAATARRAGALRAWQHAAERFLTELARNDYDRAWEYLQKADPDFRLASILLQVDPDRAVCDLIELAVFGKGVNKVALRKVLRGHKEEVFAYIRPLYATMKTDNRVNAVRLLLLFRNDADVMRFLSEIEQTEKAKKVLALVQGRKTQKALRVKNPDRKEIVAYFESAMINSVAATRERFIGELIKPPYTEVAESLFYGVYENGLLQNIVIVDRGRILDIENRDVTLPQGCAVKVLHPVELTSKTEFLKRLNITQPFAQIKRRVFVPSADDIRRGGCFGVAGTVVPLAEFTANMRKCGFRALSRDDDNMCRQVGLSRGEILCVLRIAPVDLSAKANVSVQLQCVHFYAEKDVVRLGGKRYVEGVAPCNPSVLDPRAFSEFMYSVYELTGCK